jgi:hypothetical protein
MNLSSLRQLTAFARCCREAAKVEVEITGVQHKNRFFLKNIYAFTGSRKKKLVHRPIFEKQTTDNHTIRCTDIHMLSEDVGDCRSLPWEVDRSNLPFSFTSNQLVILLGLDWDIDPDLESFRLPVFHFDLPMNALDPVGCTGQAITKNVLLR